MALRLRVVSEHQRLLGERDAIVFGVGGGSIGRSADNDWVLPDPQRYVSAHHARVHFRQGAYYLEDLSTNGAFVNGDERPVSKQGEYRLQQGDVLRLGEYLISVSLDPEPGRTAGQDAAAVPTSNIQVLKAVGPPPDADIGAALNLDELLVPDGSTGDRLAPRDAYGQAVAVEQRDDALARRMARLARAAARAEREATSLPALYDVQSGLQAFCRGAGISAEQLPAEAQTRLLHLAGQLFREAMLGLKDLERSHHELRNRFRIEMPADPDDPRPSLTRSTMEELLTELFNQHESRRLDAVQWLRGVVAAGKLHGDAVASAMRAAFADFIQRLDPAELQTRFERVDGRGKPRGARAGQWDLYAEFYRNLTETPADHLPHTFVEAFAVAYRELFEKPAG